MRIAVMRAEPVEAAWSASDDDDEMGPSEPPPPYSTQGGSGAPQLNRGLSSASTSSSSSDAHGMPLEARRSIEDEQRPLPEGWIRQIDPNSGHQFFVDTKAKPPRSIWTHPHDDPQFLQSLPDTSDIRQAHERNQTPGDAQPRGSGSKAQKQSLGVRLKDKLTGTTHEERSRKRAERKRAEEEAYKAYMQRRQQAIMMQRQRMMAGGGGYGGGMYPPPSGMYGRPMYGGYGRRPGGMAMPMMGGAAGGLLLGSMLGGM